jgi:hypothetical protein
MLIPIFSDPFRLLKAALILSLVVVASSLFLLCTDLRP